jgi:hypothetical protein
VVQWSEFLATDTEVRVQFPALPDFLRSSGSGTGSTQRHPCIRKKFTLTSHPSGGGLVGIVRSLTKATEFFYIGRLVQSARHCPFRYSDPHLMCLAQVCRASRRSAVITITTSGFPLWNCLLFVLRGVSQDGTHSTLVVVRRHEHGSFLQSDTTDSLEATL